MRGINLTVLLCCCTVLCADWPTHRANPQRTGSDDAKAGPKQPKVLWVYESSEHFIASPGHVAKTVIEEIAAWIKR